MSYALWGSYKFSCTPAMSWPLHVHVWETFFHASNFEHAKNCKMQCKHGSACMGSYTNLNVAPYPPYSNCSRGTLNPKPTLNSNFHFLLHYPSINRIYPMIKKRVADPKEPQTETVEPQGYRVCNTVLPTMEQLHISVQSNNVMHEAS